MPPYCINRPFWTLDDVSICKPVHAFFPVRFVVYLCHIRNAQFRGAQIYLLDEQRLQLLRVLCRFAPTCPHTLAADQNHSQNTLKCVSAQSEARVSVYLHAQKTKVPLFARAAHVSVIPRTQHAIRRCKHFCRSFKNVFFIKHCYYSCF